MSEPSPQTASALDARISELAQVPQLLVACDYDGTIAPIVDDPMAAHPQRETVVALRALAALPQTHVAVISGRALRDLAALSRLPAEVHLVGSHGSEFDIGFAHSLNAEAAAIKHTVTEHLERISKNYPGSQLEHKPASVAFHYRNLSKDDAAKALEEVAEVSSSIEPLKTQHGKMVVELLVTHTDKGEALERIRSGVGATAVLFAGDDATDEHAFATLAGPDVGIKVGEGETSAAFRVDDTIEMTRILADLAEQRSDWLTGSGLVPIENHSMLSDNRTVAIVTPDARVTWMCVPRIDSSAIFAELVGGPSAGYFSIAPASPTTAIAEQRYVGDSLVLETHWNGLRVTDLLDTTSGRPRNLAGRTDLLRHIEGTGKARIEFAPRLDFGRRATQLEIKTDGIEVLGATDLIVLRSAGVEWELVDEGHHQTAVAIVDASQNVTLELRCGTASLKRDSREGNRRHDTERYWQKWADKLTVPDVEAELVTRSAVILKGLCQGPTGAIVAAATTSLPETLGGIRNWDYRYCWLRDGAMTASALVELGSQGEAMDFLDWVLKVLDNREHGAERLSPLYGVGGNHLPPEAEIGELSGYGGSRPVRVGNAADSQIQLDVFGPIVDLVHRLGTAGAPLSTSHLQLVDQMVGAVESRWIEPDHGIWEIRKLPRHHVYSKTMCWLTVDRAVEISTEFFGRERPEWERLRDQIRDDILSHGYNENVGAFTAAYDGDDLDASVLMVGIGGLVAADDPRFVSTVEAIERELKDGPTVYRYVGDDGLPGHEGGFHLMTSWLIDSYALTGRRDDAMALLRELVALAGPTGLMAEEFDPATSRALGNLPQAYSHLGLILNALRLASS